MVFNGPVESVFIDDKDFVHIRLRWVAQMPYPGHPGFGRWEKAPDNMLEIVFPNLVITYTIQQTNEKGDRVMFADGSLLYLEDRGMHLAPGQVEGLEVPIAG